ncbi:MAG TPA: (Fe-S)-binding protein [Solirubrobacteraceae bacterium]|jgi:L-lactate dehydrogenase complex protein LldE|nr:(Fe-S)-binding protein [Solirubrobacteraceae bacterium]
MRIALFITCVTDTLRPDTGRATVAVLERLGHQVAFPLEQTCCGQMHANSGYQAEATTLVRRFVRAFSDEAAIDAVVTPSASCAAMVRDQYAGLAARSGDAALIREVGALLPKVFELSELLVGVLGVEDVGAYYPHEVTYHPSCHSLRLLRVGDAPLRLLRRVRGLRLTELADAASCCGFGGTFAVKNADTSTAMLADKLRHILDSGAEVCTALDNSCLLQIGGGLARERAGVRTVHLAEILAATEDAPA